MFVSSLCSGLIGAVMAQFFIIAWEVIKRRKEEKSVLQGIIVECEYNISIIDEILVGVVERNGSFKRLSVDYFRMIQKGSIKYKFHSKLLSAISRLIVDMDLFNMECDYVFDGQQTKYLYTGVVKEEAICMTKKAINKDISLTISRARDGVKCSLENLRMLAMEIKDGEEEENE